MLYFPNDQRGATIYAEEWNENTGLWGIGKEIANKDGIQARWSGWANALKAGGTWAPGQDMALRLLNPSLMVPRSISMSAHASLSCYWRLYKAPQSKQQTSPAFDLLHHWPCTDLSSGRWEPLDSNYVAFPNINSSTFLRFKDLTHEDISKWNPRLHSIYS